MILCFACYSQMKEDRAEFACMALLQFSWHLGGPASSGRQPPT
jgi:hypothetical protein